MKSENLCGEFSYMMTRLRDYLYPKTVKTLV